MPLPPYFHSVACAKVTTTVMFREEKKKKKKKGCTNDCICNEKRTGEGCLILLLSLFLELS